MRLPFCTDNRWCVVLFIPARRRFPKFVFSSPIAILLWLSICHTFTCIMLLLYKRRCRPIGRCVRKRTVNVAECPIWRDDETLWWLGLGGSFKGRLFIGHRRWEWRHRLTKVLVIDEWLERRKDSIRWLCANSCLLRNAPGHQYIPVWHVRLKCFSIQ